MQGLCSTCLSSDRNVQQLHGFSYKNTLWEWFDVGGSGNFNVNLDEFKLCWECKAMLKKVNQFKKQVFKAQKIRLKVAQNKKSSKLTNLSKLSIHTKNTYDNTYDHIDGPNGIHSFKSKEDPNSDGTASEVPNVVTKKIKTKPVNGKHKITPISLPLEKKKEKQKCETITITDSKKKINSDSVSDEGKKITKNEPKKNNTTNNDANVVKKKEKTTKNGKHISIVTIDKKEKQKNSKIKCKKRKYEEEVFDEESIMKIAKREKERDASRQGPLTEEIELAQPEVKFTIVHLDEEQMLRTRELDKDSKIYKNRAFKCENCIVGFAQKAQYEKHIKEKHSKRAGKLKCPICKVRLSRKGFLKLHADNHYRSYKCRQCDFEHHRRYQIDSHVVKEHDLKPSPVCLACDIEFDSKLLLINHYETVHEELLKCSPVETIIIESEEEEKDESPQQAENLEIMKCARCDTTFDGKASYRAHMQFEHRNLADYAYCTDCDVQFSSVHKYNRHLESSEKHIQAEKLIFDCAHCNTKFSNRDYLLAHIVRAHRLLSHTCALCNKGFSDPDRLKDHIQMKHPDVIKPPRDKKCPICSKGFAARSALLQHIRTHTADKPFKCEQCDKRFAIKAMLNKHSQRMHPKDDDNN